VLRRTLDTYTPPPNAAAYWQGADDLRDDFSTLAQAAIATRANRVKAYERSAKLIDQLHDQGFKIAVVS
jgi:hypothetical protein